MRPSRPGISFEQPQPLGGAEHAQPLQQPHGPQQPPHALGVGEQPEQDQLAEPVERRSIRAVGLLDRQAERLDQPAVADARGAGRFARAAIEAQFQVAAHRGRSAAAAFGHQPHQLDAAARAVVLVAQLGVGRASRRAQSAVDARRQELRIEHADKGRVLARPSPR